jgi:hypothetical protein
MVVVAEQIGTKRHDAIARSKEEYFVFSGPAHTSFRDARSADPNLKIPSLRDAPE